MTRARPIARVVESYNGQPCTWLRPTDAPQRPGEPCGVIHEACTGHTSDTSSESGRRGDPCRKPAMKGQLVCATHGGAAKQNREAGARRHALERAQGEAGRLLQAARVEVAGRSTVEALDEYRERAAAMVLALGLLVGELATSADADIDVTYDDKGAPHVVVTVNEEGMVGPNHAGDLTSHAFLDLYGTWLDRAAKVEKLAADLGLEERRVRLQEGQAQTVIAVIRGTLEALGASWDDARVPQLVASQLRALEATAVPS